MPITQGLHPNLSAFLDTIADMIGSTICHQSMDDGYDVDITGSRFQSYETHPFMMRDPVFITDGVESTKAGRYLLSVELWPYYKRMLNLPDFSPYSQDKWAIKLIFENDARSLVKQGKIEIAFSKCVDIWPVLDNVEAGKDVYPRFGGHISDGS